MRVDACTLPDSMPVQWAVGSQLHIQWIAVQLCRERCTVQVALLLESEEQVARGWLLSLIHISEPTRPY